MLSRSCSTLRLPWAVCPLGTCSGSVWILSQRSCLVCRLQCAPTSHPLRLRWHAFACLPGPPSIRGCSAYGPGMVLSRSACLRLILFGTCPPLCAGALWPMPAWVWRDVRSVLFPHAPGLHRRHSRHSRFMVATRRTDRRVNMQSRNVEECMHILSRKALATSQLRCTTCSTQAPRPGMKASEATAITHPSCQQHRIKAGCFDTGTLRMSASCSMPERGVELAVTALLRIA